MIQRIVMVVAPEQFRDEELLIPRQAFLEQGYPVQTVSSRTGEGVGMLGATELFTRTLEEVKACDFEALVIVGGYGAVKHLWDNPKLHKLVREAAIQDDLIAAICVSPVVLAKAGVLRGKQATVWDMPESQQAFNEAGVFYTGEAVTRDGQFITANAPEAAQAFAECIIAQLQVTAASKQTKAKAI